MQRCKKRHAAAQLKGSGFPVYTVSMSQCPQFKVRKCRLHFIVSTHLVRGIVFEQNGLEKKQTPRMNFLV